MMRLVMMRLVRTHSGRSAGAPLALVLPTLTGVLGAVSLAR